MHGRRVIIWLAFADFFCCLGLLMLGLYGRVRSAIDVGSEAAEIIERIHEKLKKNPDWKGKIEFNADNYSLRIPEAMLFDFDRRDLRNPADLQGLADAIGDEGQRFRGFTLIVTGHTDDYGPSEYNFELSRDRAESVARALQQAGLDQITFHVATRGVGASSPEVDNCSPISTTEKRSGCLDKGLRLRPKSELERNRRIELAVGIYSEALSRQHQITVEPKR
jgi:outer membrane protein OmpA-like peptidoglycan-associated protein